MAARSRAAAAGSPEGDQCPVRPRVRWARQRGGCRPDGKQIWLRCRRRRAAGRRLEQRPVRVERRLSAGGKSERALADLCAGFNRAALIQIPANQLKPCLLQNVSRKSFVTSI